jgi:hypothetical protein
MVNGTCFARHTLTGFPIDIYIYVVIYIYVIYIYMYVLQQCDFGGQGKHSIIHINMALFIYVI